MPKEVRRYHESVFMGLSLRQIICSSVAVAAAAGSYFGLRGVLGQETISWVCVLCAAPFGAAGFFSYNGLTLEKFLMAWFRSEFMCAGPRRFKAENQYQKMLEDLAKPQLPDVRQWLGEKLLKAKEKSIKEDKPVYRKGENK